MSSTIMMPSAIDTSIRTMCNDAVTQAISALSIKYGFDEEDATRHLNMDDLKIVHKRGPLPKHSEESVVKTKGKAKKEAKAKDETKPKRGKTGYLMFADAVRSTVRLELTKALEDWKELGRDDPENLAADDGKAPTPEEIEAKKVTPQQVVSEIGARWRGESDDAKAVWNDKAKEAKSQSGSDAE